VKRILVVGVALLALAAVLAMGACSDSEEEGGVVKVTESEWSVIPDRESIKAGEVTFKDTNKGDEKHELVVVKTDLPAHELPTDAEGKVDEDQVDVIGEIEEFDSGATEEATFSLTPGKYVLLCNIAEQEANGEIKSHYKKGMATAFVVE